MIGVILIYIVMKHFTKIWIGIMIMLVITAFIVEGESMAWTALRYTGYFFVGVCVFVALTWFALGTWNFIKLTWPESKTLVILTIITVILVTAIGLYSAYQKPLQGGSTNPILFHRSK